jgi:molecular chaperone GrpE
MSDENDDIVIDDEDENLDDSVLAEEAQGDTIKKLREKLKLAEGKAKEYLDSWQRSQAEFVNLRKRDEEAQSEFIKFSNRKILQELIPVLDSFNIALSQGHKELEPVYLQLLAVLKANGLEEIPAEGEEFNPNFHEAIAVVATDNKDEDHKVMETLQNGYTLSGKVIRPAKVRVGEYKN